MTNLDIEDTECRLQIGDVCCSLRFKDPTYSSYLKESFKGFISEEEPELTIDISVNATLDEEEADLPESLFISKSVNGNDFVFHDGLNKVTLNLEEKRGVVSFSRKKEGIHPVKQFNTLLFIVYYTLMKHNHLSKSKNNFLVHACGVSRDGAGYAFSGPSESGKSTIAQLSSDYSVLNDEMVIIKKENGTYIINSTPFRGDFFDKENGRAPLKAIFLIKHGNKKNVIRKISKSEFITRFLWEVAYPDPWLSANRKKVFQEMLDFCANVASEVPFYELQFLPDKRFWGSIDNQKMGV